MLSTYSTPCQVHTQTLHSLFVTHLCLYVLHRSWSHVWRLEWFQGHFFHVSLLATEHEKKIQDMSTSCPQKTSTYCKAEAQGVFTPALLVRLSRTLVRFPPWCEHSNRTQVPTKTTTPRPLGGGGLSVVPNDCRCSMLNCRATFLSQKYATVRKTGHSSCLCFLAPASNTSDH